MRTFVFVVLFAGFVDDSAVLETAKIKHTDATIGATADKDVDAASTKSNVKDFSVMCNELRLCGKGGYVPDCTSCVDA